MAIGYDNYMSNKPLQNIIYVPTLNHLKGLKNLFPGYEKALIITDSFEVGAACNHFQWNYQFLQNYLSEDTFNETISQALYITRTWHKYFSNQLKVRDIPIAKVSQYDLFFAFRIAINTFHALNHLLKTNVCNSFVIFNEMSEFPTLSTLHQSYYQTTHTIIAWLADKLDIKLITLPALNRNKMNITNQSFSTPVKSSKRYAIEQLSQQALQTQKRILSFGYSADYARLGNLSVELWKHSDYFFMFIQDSWTATITESISISNRSFLLWPFYAKEIFQQINQLWDQFTTQTHPLAKQYPYIFSNPYYHYIFRHYFLSLDSFSLKASALQIEANVLIAQAFKPDLVITGFEFDGSRKCRTELYNQLKVKTVNIPHSPMETPEVLSNYYESMLSSANNLWVPGESYKKRLMKSGLTHSNIEVIGEFNYGRVDHLYQNDASLPVDGLNKLKNFVANRPLILFLTLEAGKGMGTPYCNYSKLQIMWKEIAELSIKNQNLAFVIKTHPRYDYFHFFKKLCEKYSNLHLANEAFPEQNDLLTLKDIIPLSHCCVLTNKFSSAIVEVLEAKIPLIYLTCANYDSPELSSSSLNTGGCLEINSMVQFENSLTQLLGNKNKYQELVQRGQDFLKY